MQWIENCGRTDLLAKDISVISKSTFVCSQHFEDHMFLNDLKNRLQPHAIPTIFAGTSTEQSIQWGETCMFCNYALYKLKIYVCAL